MPRKKISKYDAYWQRVQDKIVPGIKASPILAPDPYAQRARNLANLARISKRLDAPTPEGQVRVGYEAPGKPVFRPVEPQAPVSASEQARLLRQTERELVKRGACPDCFYVLCVCERKRNKRNRKGS